MIEGYRKIKLLGKGAFGKCYLCEHPSDRSKRVVKKIKLIGMSAEQKQTAYHEAKIMAAFDHPNIIGFREVFTSANQKLNIVMDYADGGDLQSKIKDRKGRQFSENEILDIFVQTLLAIKHVHDRKVIHRDIKGQNIFLMRNGMIKLGDFGIAKVLSRTIENANTVIGTPYYMSPELIDHRPYSFKTDVWSLGVLLYELCALKPPFDASSLPGLALNIVRGSYAPLPSNFSREIKYMVSHMLNVDPDKRPSVKQILNLPFVRSRIKNVLSDSVRRQEFAHTILHNQNILQNNYPKQPDPKVLYKKELRDKVVYKHPEGPHKQNIDEAICVSKKKDKERMIKALEDTYNEGEKENRPPEELKELKWVKEKPVKRPEFRIVFPTLEEETDRYSTSELFKKYIEEQIGSRKFGEVYNAVKSHQGLNMGSQDFENAYSEINSLVSPELRGNIELVHSLVYLENGASCI